MCLCFLHVSKGPNPLQVGFYGIETECVFLYWTRFESLESLWHVFIDFFFFGGSFEFVETRWNAC